MRPEMRAAIVSLPMLCVMERNAGAEGITQRILDITGKITQETTTTLGKAGKIAAPVAIAADARTIITDSQRLSKFSELKKTRIPTQAEINEAAKSTEMLGALGGAEFIHPVREVGAGWSSRTAASAQLIQAVSSGDNAAVAAAGQRIGATTLSVAQRQAMPDNSLDMLHQNTPGLAGDSWTLGEFLYKTLSPAFEKYIAWKDNRLNDTETQEAQNTKVGNPSPTAQTKKPACGSLEWQYQPGSAECAPEEEQPAPSARSGWRLTSFNASYINPPPITDECFNFSDSIEEVTKLEAQDLVSSLGCTLGNLSIINSGNAVFTYSCQRNSQSFTSGSFEIYMSDTKIRTIRREQNTHVGDMEEEAIYEPCDPKPDCSPEGQAAWRATHNGAPAYMCSNPL